MAHETKPADTKLNVSANHRFVIYAEGRSFFYLGDTVWELFHRLNREEADCYLENQARNGCPVIQAMVWSEWNGRKTPNAGGALPFMDGDISKPGEAYSQDVDYIVNKAAD